MKKLILFLTIVMIIFCSPACEKENNKEMSLKDIFSSLPELESPSVSDMIVGSIEPGNGPIINFLVYKNDTLIKSSKLFIRVVSTNFAFGVESYFKAFFAHKNKIGRAYFYELLLLKGDISTNGMDLRNFIVKINKNQTNVYLRAERWTSSDIERYWAGKSFIGETVYFRYSLNTDELSDESGNKINLK